MMMIEFLIVPLLVWAVLSLHGTRRPSSQDETPLGILRRRYASGEINREEFEQARQFLL